MIANFAAGLEDKLALMVLHDTVITLLFCRILKQLALISARNRQLPHKFSNTISLKMKRRHIEVCHIKMEVSRAVRGECVPVLA